MGPQQRPMHSHPGKSRHALPSHLQLLQGEAPAQALLQVVLDGLAAHQGLQHAGGAGEHSLGLLSAGCDRASGGACIHDRVLPRTPPLKEQAAAQSALRAMGVRG